MTNKDIVTLAKIRQALGIKDKVMLGDLLKTAKKIRRGYDRSKIAITALNKILELDCSFDRAPVAEAADIARETLNRMSKI